MSSAISSVSSPSATAATATADRSVGPALGAGAATAVEHAEAMSATDTTRMAVLTDDHSALWVRMFARLG